MASLPSGGKAALSHSLSRTSEKIRPALEAIVRRLAASVAHNINNALTGVLGYTQLALQETRPGTTVHDHLQGSLHCAYKAAETVRDMVAYAYRPGEAGGRAQVSLREVVEQYALRVGSKLQDQEVDIVVEAASACRVCASAPLLQLVLDQLVGNAVEAMPEGGTIVLRTWQEGSRCCLSVADTGPGLPAEVGARLFEPFLTTKCSGHLGLGLVLCRDVITTQDGTIEVASAPSQGTTVTLSFPLADRLCAAEDPEPCCITVPLQDAPAEDPDPLWNNSSTSAGRTAHQLSYVI